MNSTTNDFNYELFNLISSITISAIALIGNSIIVYILAKPEFRKESFFRYLFIRTIVDTINAMLIWPSIYPDFFLIHNILIICQFNHYVNDVFNTLSSWIIVISSIDIYLTVKYPTKFHYRKKFKYQMIIFLILFITICSLYSTDFIYTITDPKNNCKAVSFQISFYLNLYSMILFAVLPFIIMAITNILTYLQLRERKINRNQPKKAKKLFKTSLGLNLFFFISNIPVFTVYVIGNISNTNFSDFFYNIFNLISFAYFSFDFFIYIIANRLFREYFYNIIKF